MTGKQRVMAAMNFQQPDRVPRYWQTFWDEFQQNWAIERGQTDLHQHFGDDMRLVAADETPWPSGVGVLEESGDQVVLRTGWGEVKRTPARKHYPQQVMGVLLEAAVPERIDPDSLVFEDPGLDSRYEDAARTLAGLKDEYYVICKTGGPYLRTAFMRGEEALWIDVAEDPDWVRALVDRTVDHMIAVGLESLRRFDLYETGIGIYDDVAASWGPFVGPRNYERIFLPGLRRMVRAYKDAGAAMVMHHCDGNVLPLLDMWIDAGIDAINPVEFRSANDPVAIRERYGDQLVCVGGLDNCDILPRGDRAEIRDHIHYLLQAGRGGGYVIGPHSIGSDISIATMEYVLELLDAQAGSES